MRIVMNQSPRTLDDLVFVVTRINTATVCFPHPGLGVARAVFDCSIIVRLGVRPPVRPGHLAVFVGCFVSCFPAPTWGLQGALVAGSSAPCTSAFCGQPFLTHGATTLAPLAKPEVQGARPLQPHESSPFTLRRFDRRFASAQRRQVVPSSLCFCCICVLLVVCSDPHTIRVPVTFASPHHQPRTGQRRIQGCAVDPVHRCGFSYAVPRMARGTLYFVSHQLLWKAQPIDRSRSFAPPVFPRVSSKIARRPKAAQPRFTRSAYSGPTKMGRSGRRPAVSAETIFPRPHCFCNRPGSTSSKPRQTPRTAPDQKRWACALTGSPVVWIAEAMLCCVQGSSARRRRGSCVIAGALENSGTLSLSPTCHAEPMQAFTAEPSLQDGLCGCQNPQATPRQRLRNSRAVLRLRGHRIDPGAGHCTPCIADVQPAMAAGTFP